jgi:hypothetical protein
MAANGLMYTSQFENVTVTNAVQDIWEIVAAAGVSVLLHQVKVTFVPTITSGVAQDVRVRLQLVERSTAGTGGSAVTPAGVNPRNTVAAASTTTRTVVTTQGTIGDLRWADQVSVIVPFELVFTADARIPIQGGGRLALFLVAAPGQAFQASSTIVFEEI